MKSIVLQLAILVISVASLTEGARILGFIPFPGKSHQRVFQPLLRALAENGHDVTVVTPFPIEDPPANYTQIQVVNVMDAIKERMGMNGGNFASHFRSSFSRLFLSVFMRRMGITMTEVILKDAKVQRLLNSQLEYDLLILETAFLQEAFIGLQHKFKAVVIDVLPAGNYHWAYSMYGNPYDSSYIVDFSLPFTDHMTFSERLQNTFMSFLYRTAWQLYYMPQYQKLMDELLVYDGWEGRPPMMDMVKNTSLVLVNTDIAVNYPYPMAAHFKEVGGINIVPPKPLPKDLQDFMDSAKDGVIYFTLGSHIQVSEVMATLKDDLAKVFGSLKQKVLWKWESSFENVPKNVMISKWFPQQDILAHKNLRLFMTHGGFLSLTEAVYHGVPLVGIPIMGDQMKNVVHMTTYGYGVHLDLENITESSLKWAINEVMDNPKYKQNVLTRSSLLRDKPRSPLDEALYWVDYVLRHKGAPHLRPAILDLSWCQQNLIDVYTTLALIFLTIFYITYKILKFLKCLVCYCFCSKKKATVSSSQNKKKVKKS